MEILLILALITAIATIIVTVKKAMKLKKEDLNNGINFKILELRMIFTGGLFGSFILLLAAMILYGELALVILSTIALIVVFIPLFVSVKILRLKQRNDKLEAKIEKLKKKQEERLNNKL